MTDMNRVEIQLERIADSLQVLEKIADPLPTIAQALEKMVPQLAFIPDNGGLVLVPEHMRETVQAVQPTPVTGTMARLAASLDGLAKRHDPAVKAIASELSDLVNLLRIGAGGQVDVDELLAQRAAAGPGEVTPRAPAVQGKNTMPIPFPDAVLPVGGPAN